MELQRIEPKTLLAQLSEQNSNASERSPVAKTERETVEEGLRILQVGRMLRVYGVPKATHKEKLRAWVDETRILPVKWLTVAIDQAMGDKRFQFMPLPADLIDLGGRAMRRARRTEQGRDPDFTHAPRGEPPLRLERELTWCRARERDLAVLPGASGTDDLTRPVPALPRRLDQ